MMEEKVPVMLTIREAAAITGLSYDFLRKLCLNNQIVYIKAGKKFLINQAKLFDFLNGNTVKETAAGNIDPAAAKNKTRRVLNEI